MIERQYIDAQNRFAFYTLHHIAHIQNYSLTTSELSLTSKFYAELYLATGRPVQLLEPNLQVSYSEEQPLIK